jgi:S-formylglutathione hydrolase FrmB
VGEDLGLLSIDEQDRRQRRVQGAEIGCATFYLLPGIDGGDNLDPGVYFEPGSKSWFGMTDIQGFFADKNVNIVSPLGGQFSWFTDWVADGSQQYQTYMTKELPPLINKELKTNGRNAVGGLSSTGGASAEAMWGPLGGPLWIAHDPSKNVTKLKGVGVYAAASGGAQGDVDRLAPGTANFTGGLIEGIVLANTQKFADAAAAAGVPINFVVRPEGSHTWGLFESEMQESWNTTIGPALGVR